MHAKYLIGAKGLHNFKTRGFKKNDKSAYLHASRRRARASTYAHHNGNENDGEHRPLGIINRSVTRGRGQRGKCEKAVPKRSKKAIVMGTCQTKSKSQHSYDAYHNKELSLFLISESFPALSQNHRPKHEIDAT